MRCEVPIRRLGEVDIAPFCAVLAQQPESLWTADLSFQRKIAPIRDTQTIYLAMTLGSVQGERLLLAGWEPFREVLAPILERVSAFFGGGTLINAQIAKLEPGGRIPRHVDRGPVLESCHRIHIPLETHDLVEFEVEGNNLPLAVGQVYELDNMRSHSVFNGSPIRRIHLVIDYFDGPVNEKSVV